MRRFIFAALLLLAPIAGRAQVITNPTTLPQFCVDRTVTPWVIGHARKDGKCAGEMTQDPTSGAIGLVIGQSMQALMQRNPVGGAGFTVQSGPLGFSDIISGGLPQYDALRGIAYIGTGTQTIGQGTGIAGYAVSDHNATDPGQAFPVGVYGYGRTSKANTNAWGFNSVAEDAPSGSGPGTVAGITLQNEYDFNVMETGTVVFGSNVIGTFLAQPATAFGYLCQLNEPTSYVWSSCYTSQDAVTDSFASIALANRSTNGGTIANNPSQALNFSWLDDSKNRLSAALRFIPGASINVLDLSGTGVSGFRAGNLFLPTGGILQAANAAGGTPINVFSTDSNNHLNIGGAANGIYLQSNTFPLTANSAQLGSSALPFAQVWATSYFANGAAGLSCSGAPTASFATINGITTHC